MSVNRKRNFLTSVLDLDLIKRGRNEDFDDLLDEEDDEEKAKKPTNASREFYTDFSLWLYNYRSEQIDVQEGGMIKRKFITDVDDVEDIARSFIDRLQKRYLGQRIGGRKDVQVDNGDV